MKRSTLIIVIGVIAALLLVTAQAFAAAPQADLTGKPTPKPHDGQIDDDKGKPDKPFKLNGFLAKWRDYQVEVEHRNRLKG